MLVHREWFAGHPGERKIISTVGSFYTQKSLHPFHILMWSGYPGLPRQCEQASSPLGPLALKMFRMYGFKQLRWWLVKTPRLTKISIHGHTGIYQSTLQTAVKVNCELLLVEVHSERHSQPRESQWAGVVYSTPAKTSGDRDQLSSWEPQSYSKPPNKKGWTYVLKDTVYVCREIGSQKQG